MNDETLHRKIHGLGLLNMSYEEHRQEVIDELKEVFQLEVEHLLDAIRDHRAAKTPGSWSESDKKLYGHLPEVKDGTTVVRQ